MQEESTTTEIPWVAGSVNGAPTSQVRFWEADRSRPGCGAILAASIRGAYSWRLTAACGARSVEDCLPVAIQTTTLDNGLRVTAIGLPHLHTASISVFVKVGSRFERPEDNGLSHFVEHMLFRGTDRHPSSRELSVAIESLGSSLHAETGRDLSVFHLAVEPEFVAAAMELLAEVLSRPSFADIELERSIILEEMIADYDEDGMEVNGDDIARGLLFGDHPLGQRIIGPERNVRRFTEADVRRHFTRHYTACNMHVCVAGPVVSERVQDTARAYFGHLQAGAPISAQAPELAQDSVRYRHIHETGSQTSVHLLFHSIPDMQAEYLASVALRRALDDGMSTPLHYELCDQRGLAYEISAGIEPLADVALFDITGATSQAKVPQLIAGILTIIERFRSAPISAAALTRIKRRYRYELASVMDDSYAIASLLCSPALYYRPHSMEERLQRMDEMTAEDIRSAAQTIFRPDRMVAAVVGPLSRARKGEVRDLVQGWR